MKYFFFILAVVLLFFWPILKGQIPFPGDILISEYSPWKSYSYLGYNPGSFPNKAQYIDVVREFYPWKSFTLSQLKNGELPFWNPYSFSGFPHLSNFQTAVFYPLNILYLFFSQINAWTILVILQPLLSLIFTYQYCRKIGLTSPAAIFAAISFSFSFFMIVWIEYNTIWHAIIWLPLSLLCIEHLLKKFTIRWSSVFVFSLVSSLFAGHPQVFGYVFVFTLAYLITRLATLKVNFKKRVFLSVLSLQLLSIGITAVQLLPGLELIREAARSPHDYEFLINKILIQPFQLVMLFVPDFFGNPATRNYLISDTYIGKVTSIGIIPLFFVLFSFIRKKNSLEIFFLTSSAIVLLLVTNNPIAAALYKIQIPFVSSSAPTLAVFIFCFSFSMLSGFGIDKWRKESLFFKELIKWLLPGLFLFALLWLIALRKEEYFLVTSRNLLYSTLLFSIGIFFLALAHFKRKLVPIILILLISVHLFDLWRSFHKFNPFSDKTLVFPKTEIFDFIKKEAEIYRFWGYGGAYVEANFPVQYSLFSPEGSDPLYPKRYGEFLHSSANGKILKQFDRTTRSDAVIARGFGEKDFPSNPYRLKVLNATGVKYILDRVENGSTSITFPPDQFKMIYDKDGWKAFENLKVVNRFFITSKYKIFNTKEEFENLFFSSDFNPSTTILLEEKPEGSFKEKEFDFVKLSSYSPNKVEFELQNGNDSLFYISDTYYPGWKAYVDGKESKIYRANYTFRAVVLPANSKNLSFVFESQSFKNASFISLGSVLVALFVSVSLRKKRWVV